MHRILTLLLAAILILLPLAPASGATESDETANPAHGSIQELIKNKKYQEAEAAARALLSTQERELGTDSVEVAATLALLAETIRHQDDARASKIAELLRRVIRIKEKNYGLHDLRLVDDIKKLGDVMVDMGKYEETQPLDARVLEIRKKALGPEHPDVAKSLEDMAWVQRWLGNPPEARRLCEESLAITEKALGSDHVNLAECLGILTAVTYNAGDIAGARKLTERRLQILTDHHGPDHPAVSRALNALSHITTNAGDYLRSEELLKEALRIVDKARGPGHSLSAQMHKNLGSVYKEIGEYGLAQDSFQRAVAIWEKRGMPDDPSVALGKRAIAGVLQLYGDLDDARQLSEEALRTREKKFGADNIQIIGDLVRLGAILLDSGETMAAGKQYERALAIAEKAGNRPLEVAVALAGLSRVDSRLGRQAKAKVTLEKVLEIRKKTFGTEVNPFVAGNLAQLARLQLLAKNRPAARATYEKVLKIQEQLLGDDHPSVARTLHALGTMDLEEGDRLTALARARRVTAIGTEHIRETLSHLPERQALLLVSTRVRPESIIFKGLLDSGTDHARWLESAWNWSLGHRGIVLDELGRRNRSVASGESEEARAAWAKLSKARRYLGSLWVRGASGSLSESHGAAMNKARKQKEAAEIALARVSEDYRKRRSPARPDLVRLRKALPKDSALIEFARVDMSTALDGRPDTQDFALILPASGKPAYRLIGPAARTDRLVEDWRKLLQESASSFGAPESDSQASRRLHDAGIRLRNAVWDPLEDSMGTPQRLFLVPDGSLHLVDFLALPMDKGKFLVETAPAIHYLSTARDLIRWTGESRGSDIPRGRGVLALGAPDFDASGTTRLASLDTGSAQVTFRGKRSSCNEFLKDRWAPLPESAREVSQIDSMLKEQEPVLVLTGSEASEERLKLEAGGKRVLHLATHGFFLQGRCRDAQRVENPLLLSGLILAGANASPGSTTAGTDDGILTAEEMAALDLRGVELAVMSACDTGRGEVAVGEGVFGLRRALEIAGVRTVLTSLWPVPDRQTRRWMRSFYAARIEGDPVFEATRKASLQALEDAREKGGSPHPYLWSGFVAAGDWR
jgi:CHAT domain-containing protein/tetratricopeptide (TPR) repeat protein